MAKDLRLDVVTSSDPRGLLSTAAEIDRLAGKTDKLGHDFDKTAVEGAFLAKELEAVKLKAAELARQFDDTGDKAILKQITRTQTYERQLQRVGTELDKVGVAAEKEGTKLGKDLAKGTESGFQEWLSGANQGGGIMGFLVTPEGIAVAAAAATAGGVIIGGALLAGIGLAGIGVGVAAELKNPLVAAALQGLKSDIGSALKDAATPFIAPLLGAFSQLGVLVKSDIGPGLKSMFTELAPEIGIVTHGFGEFLSKVVTGFEHAAVASKPLLDVLGSQLLPQLGQDILAMFDTIAHHAPEAEQGLKALFAILEIGIGSINVAINAFSALWNLWILEFQGLVIAADKTVGALLAVHKALHLPHDNLDEAKKSLDGLVASTDAFRTNADGVQAGFGAAALGASAYAAATYIATQDTRDLQTAWDALTKALSADQASTDALNQIASLQKALDKHSKSLETDTQAGRDNRNALEDRIGALARDRDALIKNGMSAKDADKLFQGWVKSLEKSAEKAGVSAAQVDKLNTKLGLLPKNKTVNVHVNVFSSMAAAAIAAVTSSVKAHAGGGRFLAGDTMLVGEDRPEIVKFDRGGTVIPRVPSAMAGSSSGAGGAAPCVHIHLHGSAKALISDLANEVRGSFGGNVQVAFGGHG